MSVEGKPRSLSRTKDSRCDSGLAASLGSTSACTEIEDGYRTGRVHCCSKVIRLAGLFIYLRCENASIF